MTRSGVVYIAALTMLCFGRNVNAASTTIFRDVNVLPMDQVVVLPSQAVVVEDGTITAVGPNDRLRTPAGAVVVNGRGQYLLPGLVDFHTHPQAPEELVSYLASGVTTIVAFDGEVIEWKRLGLRPPPSGTRMLGTTHIFEGVSAADTAYSVKDPADVPEILDHEQALGADLVKIYVHMTMPVLRALVREGHARGMPVTGHTPIGLPVQDVLGRGLDLVAHSEEFKRYLTWESNDADYASIVSRVASHHISVVANLVAVRSIEGQAKMLVRVLADPEVRYLSSTAYQSWSDRNNAYSHRPQSDAYIASVRTLYEIQKRVVRQLNDAGALLLLGTDAPVNCVPGVCVHEEIQLLKDAGLSNYDVLRSATFNAGVFVATQIRARAAERFGVVTEGALADLLLVDGNPLLDLSAVDRITGVMARGNWYTATDLQRSRTSLLPDLSYRHKLVDEYERLFMAGDLLALFRFLDNTRVTGAPLLSEPVLCNDAATVASTGDTRDAIALLSHAEHLTGGSFLIRNALGRLKLASQDLRGAAAEFRRSLDVAPHNAAAELGLQHALSGDR